MALYLTRSAFLDRSAAAIRNAPGPAGRFPVPIDIRLMAVGNQPPVLTGSFTLPGGEPVTVRVEADFIPERAGGRPTTREEITRQIAKAGKTAFRVGKLDVLCDGGLFLPVGQLNRFRRLFFDVAEKTLLSWYLPGAGMREAADHRLAALLPALARPDARKARIPELAIFCNETDAVIAACEAGCDRVCFEPDPEHMEDDLRQAIQGCREKKVRFAWKWPRVQVPEFTREALSSLPRLTDAGLEEVMVEGAMYADTIHTIAPGIRVTGGADLNVFNACAFRALSPDCSGLTLSPELSGEDIGCLCNRIDEKGMVCVIVQGNIPAMITADTLLNLVERDRGPEKVSYGLSDATGRIFPVHPDSWGRTHILNAAELCLIDYLPALSRAGVDTFIIDGRWRGPSYADRMVSVYREAMDVQGWMAGKEESPDPVRSLKGQIRGMAQGGITAGHYLRGLSDD
jgi:putative protease